MTGYAVTYRVAVAPGMQVIAPGGLDTPQARLSHMSVSGGHVRPLTEGTTGQIARLIEVDAGEVTITWHFDAKAGRPYPDDAFHAVPSRFTRFADQLVQEVAEIAPEATPEARAVAIACATAERFTYGHPEARFNDGFEEVPALGCGLTEGSCVDINTYFIASLRAAGIDAAYITGAFFPAEKDGTCEDGHCWVVTRIDGQYQEWDIAHHLKMGTRAIAPGLNPKPGFRAALFHSMGVTFPGAGVGLTKALIEPMWVQDGRLIPFDAPEIRLLDAAQATAAQ